MGPLVVKQGRIKELSIKVDRMSMVWPLWSSRATLIESSLSLPCLTTNGPTAVKYLFKTSSQASAAPCSHDLVPCGRDNGQDFGLQSDYQPRAEAPPPSKGLNMVPDEPIH